MAGFAATPLARAKHELLARELITAQSAAGPGFRLTDVTSAAGFSSATIAAPTAANFSPKLWAQGARSSITTRTAGRTSC